MIDLDDIIYEDNVSSDTYQEQDEAQWPYLCSLTKAQAHAFLVKQVLDNRRGS